MKAFISGVAGFIGSHLAEKLLESGNSVVGIDDLSSGTLKNVAKIVNNPSFRFINGDVRNFELIKYSMKGCDIVYHLSDKSDIQYANEHTKDYFDQNIISLYNILEGMKINGIRKIVYPSSTTVFGENCTYPTDEGFGPLRPINLYGASKAAAESYLHSYTRQFDIEASVFRFASVIGARQDHGVVHDFVKKLLADNGKLSVLGNGTQKRSYILIDDCVEVLKNAYNFLIPKYQIIHLANNDVITISNVAQIVADIFKLPHEKILYQNNSIGWSGDSKSNELSMGYLREIGWAPTYNSSDSVRIAALRLKSFMTEEVCNG